MTLYQTTWGFTGRGPGRGQDFDVVPVGLHLSAACGKSLYFKKLMRTYLQLLTCTALSSTFLLVKLLQVTYIPKPFDGFVVHSFEIECSQSSL